MALSSGEVVMVALAYRIRQFTVDTSAQGLMEYGLLVALISLVAMLAVNSVGTVLNNVFWQVISNGLSSSSV